MAAANRLILAINPGSTSTKIAVYENETVKFKSNVIHNTEELARYNLATDQYELRKAALLTALREAGVKPEELSAVVGRGGILPPVKSGAYVVNEQMVDRLRNRHLVDHASNLGPVLAYEIAQAQGIPALIYDSVAVDELSDIARISGLPELPRQSRTHALNMRAAAMKLAQKLDRPYPELNLIVAHLGGGISVSLHLQGKMADIVSDDEGALSPERAGKVPCRSLAELCYSGRYDQRGMIKRLQGNGGLVAYLGTNDAQEVERRAVAGDQDAALVYQAMAYQVAKSIGELAVVAKGKLDAIVITGGIAYSALFTGWIREMVEFIAPVEVLAGENELESLALGALRVLAGDEIAREYDCD